MIERAGRIRSRPFAQQESRKDERLPAFLIFCFVFLALRLPLVQKAEDAAKAVLPCRFPFT